MTDDELLNAMGRVALRHEGSEISDMLEYAADRIHALIAERDEHTDVCGESRDEGCEIKDEELFFGVSNSLSTLVRERNDWKVAADGLLGRTLKAEAEVERLRAALRLVRAAIIAASPDVLTDTLWLADSPSETAVDCIDAALAEDKP